MFCVRAGCSVDNEAAKMKMRACQKTRKKVNIQSIRESKAKLDHGGELMNSQCHHFEDIEMQKENEKLQQNRNNHMSLSIKIVTSIPRTRFDV